MPSRLQDLSAPLQEITDFLKIDEDLIAAAAAASPASRDDNGLAGWIASLPAGQKDTLLPTWKTRIADASR